MRQAASKTKLLIEKRERKYFIGSLTTFSCAIQHSVAKQMLWSKNHQLFLFPGGTVWEHKPLLPLKKNLRKTPRISVSFIVMSCYYENDCFEFMLHALNSLHWLRPVGKIWISHNSWNRSSQMRKTVTFKKQKMSTSLHFFSCALLCLHHGFKVVHNDLGNCSFCVFFIFISKGNI